MEYLNNSIMIRPEKKRIAQELKAVFLTISPYIERHTSVVCPDCTKVCCADRHAQYDRDDVVFLRTLGIEIPDQTNDGETRDTCRFMSDNGCSLERWMRPYRCTFFFCDILLKSLDNDDTKLYRAFLDYFHHLVSLRQKLLE